MNFIKNFDKPMISLSNAPHNGGIFKANGFFFMHVDKNYNSNYKEDCLRFEKDNEIKDFIGFLTAANISKILSSVKIGHVESYVTAGITNPAIAGDDVPRFLDRTINIAIIIKDGLTFGALANAIMTATEAKTYTLLKLGYKATGTTSDGIGVFAYEGNKEWAGTATDVGIKIGKAVRKSLEESLKKWEIYKANKCP